MKDRSHRFVLVVRLDRKMDRDRARWLLEDAINQIAGMGKDYTRQGKPETLLVRAKILSLGKVVAAEIRKRDLRLDDDALIRIAAKRVCEGMKE